MLALHALALGTVLADHKHHADYGAARDIQIRPVGAIRAAPGVAYDVAKGELRAGRLAPALDGFRQAVREAPQSVDALNGLAVVYDLLGRYDQSRLYYEAALAVDPTSALVASNYGYSLYQQGDFTAARPLLLIAVAGDDEAARAASRNTLQMIARRGPPPPVVAEAPAAPDRATWIEQTGTGEQRLVLDAPLPAAARANDTPVEMALVAPASAWTSHDEARVERVAQAEELAARIDAAPTVLPARLAQPAQPELALSSPDLTVSDLTMPAFAGPSGGEPAAKAVVVTAAALRGTGATPTSATATIGLASSQMVAASRTPRLVVIAGYRLIAAVANVDPSRRRRAATISVGGVELARQMVAQRQPAAIAAAAHGLDRLTMTLARIGTAASDEVASAVGTFDRLSAGLAMLAA